MIKGRIRRRCKSFSVRVYRLLHNLDAQRFELPCMGSAQHQVTNHGVTGVTNPARSNDDADNSRSGAVMVKITDAFIHHGEMIGV